jgi:hypothetical protein
LATLGGNCCLAQSTRPDQDDTQLWNDVQLIWPVSKRFDAIVNGTLRIGDGISRPVDERIGFAMSAKARRHLTITPGYLHINMQPTPGHSGVENRITLPFLFQVRFGKTALSERSQFEFRFRDPLGTQTRYRNWLIIGYALRNPKITVFISDEIFYDWSVGAWVRNRAAVGFNRQLGKRMSADFYYLRQNDGRSVPGDLNVIGVAFRYQLPK